MTPELAITIISQALWVILLISCAIILPSMVAGLAVAIFSAVTQINEQTLSFFPRLVATLGAMAFFSHYIGKEILELFEYTFQFIALISER